MIDSRQLHSNIIQWGPLLLKNRWNKSVCNFQISWLWNQKILFFWELESYFRDDWARKTQFLTCSHFVISPKILIFTTQKNIFLNFIIHPQNPLEFHKIRNFFLDKGWNSRYSQKKLQIFFLVNCENQEVWR